MDYNLILFISILILGLGGLIGFLIWKKKELNRASYFYSFLAVIFLGLTGFSGIILNNNSWLWFGLLGLLWIGFGGIHTWIMYSLKWSKRNSRNDLKDSFWPEFLFTLAIGILGTAGFFGLYLFLTNPGWAYYYLPISLGFPLIFLSLKIYDFAEQMLPEDFEIKWFHPAGNFDYSGIPDGGTKIYFKIAKNSESAKRPLSRDSKAFVTIPSNTSLGDAFRIAIIEYNLDYPAESEERIANLGYENSGKELWWLFRLKIILWRPRTWQRNKYLDPNRTLDENKLSEGDVVKTLRFISEYN